MISYDQTTEDCLVELFKRVGEPYPNELTKQDKWYHLRAWTKDEEADFKKWMDDLLKSRYKWSKSKRSREVAYFLLAYGWKNK